MKLNLNFLKRRILGISYKHKLSHLGSCLTALSIIIKIYEAKGEEEPFVLSAGHSALALYCVLEAVYGHDAEELFLKHGVHPNRDLENHIYCSAGSLGHGVGIAVGMALSDRSRKVYCFITDGECAEGSVWEALRVKKEAKLHNLKVFCNVNGWGAYRAVNQKELSQKLTEFGVIPVISSVEQFPFLKGNKAHYHIMSAGDYKLALEKLK